MVTALILVIVVFLFSITINIFLYKALKAQMKKVSLYESLLTDYDSWAVNVRQMLASTYVKMKNIDNKEWFFKDEDVGAVFQELLSLLKNLNDRIQQ